MSAPPVAGERRAYLVSVTEGPWDDWFVSVSLADDRGRRITQAIKDNKSLSALLPDLLDEITDAIVEDFLEHRSAPRLSQRMRRWLTCQLLRARHRRPAPALALGSRQSVCASDVEGSA